MATHGGKRQGAGRKPGSLNKASRAVRAKAAEEGQLPHELLLDWARGTAKVKDFVKVDGEVVEIERFPTFEERIDAAKAAAPFYAPKLAAVAPVMPPDPNDNTIKHLMEQVHGAATSRVAVKK